MMIEIYYRRLQATAALIKQMCEERVPCSCLRVCVHTNDLLMCEVRVPCVSCSCMQLLPCQQHLHKWHLRSSCLPQSIIPHILPLVSKPFETHMLQSKLHLPALYTSFESRLLHPAQGACVCHTPRVCSSVIGEQCCMPILLALVCCWCGMLATMYLHI